MNIAFAVTEVGTESAAGDYFTALELGNALAARYGWLIHYLPKGNAWYDLAGVDILIVMVEDFDLRLMRNAALGLITVAWARNWFERWCDQPCIADYSVHMASSRRAADYMSQRIGKRVRLLRIATNAERFNMVDRPQVALLDYVFTGSYWQAERDVVNALAALPTHFRGAVYGKNWAQVPVLAALNRGFVPYSQMPGVYRQATMVVDDANHVTKTWGAANSRVFDALAAGCLVISNSASVSQEVFDGLLPVYTTPAELATLLQRYLSDAPARLALQSELRGRVLQRHLYQHRALEFFLHLSGCRELKWAQTKAGATSLPPAKVAVELASTSMAAAPLPSISFIVPLFNHLQHTQAMLASLLASLPPGLDFEVILADDASTDGTAAWLQTQQNPRIKTLISAVNQGYAANNNAAAHLARGDVLALLNNDLLFEPGWLAPMLDILLDPVRSAGGVGNVQRRIDNGAVDHAGVCLNSLGQLEHMRELPAGGAAAVQVFAVTGACMLLRRADFEACGGFDTAYVNGGEDVDLCFKLRAAGHRIYVAPESCIGHHVSLSRGPTSLNDERNSRRLFKRWRRELKNELSRVWRQRLATGAATLTEDFDGLIDPACLATPQLASLRIAEALLQRHEARWAQLLD
ncbi:MAG: glycosyltransferase [Rhodoferax sp.]|uniref:glycosyltransferase n=1 Tax=Rhodoferax sp. TaxID=50421 RepID=UPI0026259013|nr:glycosyltransferase [Rhodoferax sp.]MDD2882996.1 glycosyltransferase [Rhodoferax sp.]